MLHSCCPGPEKFCAFVLRKRYSRRSCGLQPDILSLRPTQYSSSTYRLSRSRCHSIQRLFFWKMWIIAFELHCDSLLVLLIQSSNLPWSKMVLFETPEHVIGSRRPAFVKSDPRLQFDPDSLSCSFSLLFERVSIHICSLLVLFRRKIVILTYRPCRTSAPDLTD